MKRSATIAAISDRCAVCAVIRFYHCDESTDPQHCSKIHSHAFESKPDPVLSNKDILGLLNARIMAIEFDIATLQRGKDGARRNAKAIRDLQNAIVGYKQRRDNLRVDGE